jgi:uncharacterized membrane protein
MISQGGPGTAVNEELAIERIVFFSDAVMAIAMTLLAVDLKIPQIAGSLNAEQLGQTLSSMSPQFISFFISFMLVGIYWAFHLRMFRFIKRSGGGLILLNLIFLLAIVMLPFTSNLVGAYGNLALADVLYASNAAFVGLAALLIWLYATHGRRLVGEDLDAGVIRLVLIGGLGAPLGFLLSIPVALLDPSATQYVWWFVPGGVTIILRRLMRPRTVQG